MKEKTGVKCPVCSKSFIIGDIVYSEPLHKIECFDKVLEACKEALRHHQGMKSEIGNILRQAINQAEATQ